MAMTRQRKRTAEEYADELKQLIRRGIPDAEFEFYKRAPKEYDLDVFGGFTEMWPVLDLVGDRTTDILLESGIHIDVLPLGRKSNHDS
jgi:hypothetical protein